MLRLDLVAASATYADAVKRDNAYRRAQHWIRMNPLRGKLPPGSAQHVLARWVGGECVRIKQTRNSFGDYHLKPIDQALLASVTARFSLADYGQLTALAREKHISVSELVRSLVQREMSQRKDTSSAEVVA